MSIPVTRYDTAAPTRRRATSPEDLHRLAGLARERGIRIYQDRATGAWHATSATDPGAVYHLSGYSCTCAGFIAWQRCSHHSALLDHLGWLPPVADAPPAPVAVAPPCRRSRGRGFVYAEAGPDQWPFEIPCADCADRGDDAPDDDCREHDDLDPSAPDDGARFAFVASRYRPDPAA